MAIEDGEGEFGRGAKGCVVGDACCSTVDDSGSAAKYMGGDGKMMFWVEVRVGRVERREGRRIGQSSAHLLRISTVEERWTTENPRHHIEPFPPTERCLVCDGKKSLSCRSEDCRRGSWKQCQDRSKGVGGRRGETLHEVSQDEGRWLELDEEDCPDGNVLTESGWACQIREYGQGSVPVLECSPSIAHFVSPHDQINSICCTKRLSRFGTESWPMTNDFILGSDIGPLRGIKLINKIIAGFRAAIKTRNVFVFHFWKPILIFIVVII